MAAAASLSVACASGFDAKAQATSLGAAPAAASTSDDAGAKQRAPRPPLSRLPFAVVRLLVKPDVFAPLPKLPLPIDAHVEQETNKTGKRSSRSTNPNAVESTRRSLEVRLPGTHERFDLEVGDHIVAALPVPNNVAIVFRYKILFGIGTYEAMTVRAQPIATIDDLASAEIIPWGTAAADSKLVAVKITFTDEGKKHLAANAEEPVLWLLEGRVVRKDERLVVGDEHRLVFEWPDVNEARAVAEQFVARVRSR